jgi:hypothetical protein
MDWPRAVRPRETAALSLLISLGLNQVDAT